jgi:formimidoylglutamate deiminase
VRDTAQFMNDWQELRRRYPAGGAVRLGMAFHSLRAVSLEVIGEVDALLQADPLCRCVHIHVAEQPAEVAACTRQYGAPPVALLARENLLSPRWALVHATHSSEAELAQLRASGATLVLCPTTEADLGDGCPVVEPFLNAGGRLAIGSDSNIGRSALEELRWLEWSQRLARGRRNVLACADAPAVADRLYSLALQGGRSAVGGSARADFVTYDTDAGDWALQDSEDYLGALVFDTSAPRARQVMVAGRWVIRDGRHAEEEQIEARYRDAVQAMRAMIRSRKDA